MKTVVIVGGTRDAARKRLEKIVHDNGVVRQEWYDEVEIDDHRIMAFSGGPDDVDNICWLRGLGANNIAEIILVERDGISEEMLRHVNYVCSANGRR